MDNKQKQKILKKLRNDDDYYGNFGKQFLSNSLEDIHGIGKKTISNLLSQYGSIKNIKRAKRNDLTHVRGVTHKLAKNILQELNK